MRHVARNVISAAAAKAAAAMAEKLANTAARLAHLCARVLLPSSAALHQNAARTRSPIIISRRAAHRARVMAYGNSVAYVGIEVYQA